MAALDALEARLGGGNPLGGREAGIARSGRAGAEVAQRGQDKHLHYSRGVTVEEMRQASMALMRLVPTAPSAAPKARDLGRDRRGRDRNSDEERLAATGT